MKADINADGVMSIMAETDMELYALGMWSKSKEDCKIDPLKFVKPSMPIETETREELLHAAFSFFNMAGLYESPVPKEKTYSQADMDGAQKTINRLTSDKLLLNKAIKDEQARNEYVSRKYDALLRTCEIFEKVKTKRDKALNSMEEDLIGIKNANKYLGAKNKELQHENDKLKIRLGNLEFCDKFVCGFCDTVIWAEKGTADIVTCPACESPVGKES